MPAIADNVAGLGTGDYNFQEKIIQYGPVGKKERHRMRWRSDMATPCWVSDDNISIENRDSWILDPGTVPAIGTTWGYVYSPAFGVGAFGASSYSWSPNAIRHADAAFDAGLKLQERIIADAWVWEPTDVEKIATVWFPMNQGDRIDNTLIPDANLGIIYQLAPGQRRFKSTGWLNSAITSCTKANLMPHLYSQKTAVTSGPNSIEFFICYWRWVSV